MAGGWTGFIFGRSTGKTMQLATIGAVNGALLTWLLAAVSVSKVKALGCQVGAALNPFATNQDHEHLRTRITQLQQEISVLKERQQQQKQ